MVSSAPLGIVPGIDPLSVLVKLLPPVLASNTDDEACDSNARAGNVQLLSLEWGLFLSVQVGHDALQRVGCPGVHSLPAQSWGMGS